MKTRRSGSGLEAEWSLACRGAFLQWWGEGVASISVQGVEEKLPREDLGERVPATGLSSWEAPEVGANLEKTGGWRVWGRK